MLQKLPDKLGLGVKLGLGAWLVGTTLLCGLLLARHQPLPETSGPPSAVIARISANLLPSRGRLRVVHFLFESCGCSQRVLASLLAHRAEDGAVERIVLVRAEKDSRASELAAQARALGYEVDVQDRDQVIRKYGLVSAPVMVVLTPAGALAYLGGYSRRPSGPLIEDRDILARVRRGERVPPFKTFGCAVGRRLSARINPLRL